MFYIEKNDKPNFIEKKLGILKITGNTIMIPITENTKEKQIEKIATKTNKIIEKHSNSRKVVLSKEIQKEQTYINYLNTNGIEISDGKWLFEILLTDTIEYIIKKKQLQKVNISILINDLTDTEYENIKILARKYKTINIVTNHIEKFKKIEKNLEQEGIIITITNNKKKSLKKSQIIINIDFPKELINKYTINDEAILINIKEKIKINKKRFNGLNINDYEIDYRNDKKEDKALSKKYYLKDLYESQLYKKQRIKEIKEKIAIDKVIIKKLILNNGEL
ncbi:MAG: hypothetical protein IJE05_03560 [Clostridia bacterium]|nr:hypothetical protein [Clostridia bacterium]